MIVTNPHALLIHAVGQHNTILWLPNMLYILYYICQRDYQMLAPLGISVIVIHAYQLISCNHQVPNFLHIDLVIKPIDSPNVLVCTKLPSVVMISSLNWHHVSSVVWLVFDSKHH